ncbi:MAG: Gfo/Idh/MocA family oxidoreductase, partial [Defluviitaleaceae bacterium]|nr:Gfo/Idh/MocA family oxidoreductase [Defluviitaleaceae bacterium]
MYNIGIIGFGGMGHQHFLAVSSHPKARVKGVFDINPKRIEFAESLGLVTYPDAQAFFDDPEIDIVIVASTNDVHGEHSINAIMAGKHVICEKPATITSAELKEVMYVAEKHNKIFTINQNRRRDRDFLLMKESVEKGILGDIYDIQSRTHGSRGIPKGWRTTKSLGGGMMLDWGVHLIDQILHMTSEKVTNVFCKMYNIHYDTVDDNFKLILTFESGLTAQIEVGTNNLIPQPRWYVLGKEGTLQIDDWDCTGKIIRCTHKEDTWDEEIAPTKAGPSKTMSPRSANSTQTIEISSTMDWVQNKGLEAVYNQFFDAIEGSAELKITPEQALRVMKVIEAAFLSNET